MRLARLKGAAIHLYATSRSDLRAPREPSAHAEQRVYRGLPRFTLFAVIPVRRSLLMVGTTKGVATMANHTRGKKCIRWTAEEDEVIRTRSIKDAFELLKNHRTEIAVRLRRVKIGAIIPKNHWTKVEDRRIRRTALLPVKEVVKLFKNRTAIAIAQRRYDMGCQRRRGPKRPWMGTEIKLLQRMWPTCTPDDVPNAFPRHSLEAVYTMARRLGIRKTRTFDVADIHEQIKARAREDGISFRSLAAEIGCGYSFLKPRKPHTCDFNKVAKAVEFFGGRLVIDWQDE
jgi:hypothetical protein